MALDLNYTLGRGVVYFSKFKPGTQDPEGFRDFGDVKELKLNFAAEKLEHYSSRRGLKEKDLSLTTQINRTGSMTTESIMSENLALFFFGSTSVLTIVGATVASEAIDDVKLGYFYQLGVSPSNPSGARDIVYPGAAGTAFSLKKSATALVSGTDFKLDPVTGMLEILEGGTVVDGDDLTAGYTTNSGTRDRTVSGSTPIEGALRYVSANAHGKDQDYFLPYVSLSPNGDFDLIGDALLALPFTLDILKRPDMEALYIDGRPGGL